MNEIYCIQNNVLNNTKKLNSLALVRELYGPRDRRLSAKLVPTFADRGCHVVSMTDPYDRILGFLDWSRRFFFHQLLMRF
jgi:hypothetical protein